jgi:chromosome segregation ATPase
MSDVTNAQIARVEVLFEDLQSKVGAVAEGVTMVSDKVDRMDARLGRVEGQFVRVEARLGAVEWRLDRVETRLDGVETRLGGVEHELHEFRAETGARLERLEQHVGLPPLSGSARRRSGRRAPPTRPR